MSAIISAAAAADDGNSRSATVNTLRRCTAAATASVRLRKRGESEHAGRYKLFLSLSHSLMRGGSVSELLAGSLSISLACCAHSLSLAACGSAA